MRHSEANAEESSAEKRLWILHYVQDDDSHIFWMTACAYSGCYAVCVILRRTPKNPVQKNVSGSFTTFRMTRTRNAWNDIAGECRSAFVVSKSRIKKEDSTFVESSFCGCQDSNLEQYEDRPSLNAMRNGMRLVLSPTRPVDTGRLWLTAAPVSRFRETKNRKDQSCDWSFLLRVPGLEPGAFWFVAKRSIQLGYIRVLSSFVDVPKYRIVGKNVKG